MGLGLYEQEMPPFHAYGVGGDRGESFSNPKCPHANPSFKLLLENFSFPRLLTEEVDLATGAVFVVFGS